MNRDAVTFVCSFALAASAACAGVDSVLTFDNLPNPPALDQRLPLSEANGGGSVIEGVTFDSRFQLHGRDVRISNDPTNPLFGRPHSGDFYLSNGQHAESVGLSNDAMILTTDRVLLSLWAGQNEYYGFGGGADQLTITAFGGNGNLGAIVLDLPDNAPGDSEVLGFFDTSAFTAFRGQIEGYRINRRMLGSDNGNYILDTLTFEIPAPGAVSAFGAMIACSRGTRRRRHAA